MNVHEIIERDRTRVQAIAGVVDLAYGEDDAGPHALVFVETADDSEGVRHAIDRLSLLKGCRVVIEEKLLLG